MEHNAQAVDPDAPRTYDGAPIIPAASRCLHMLNTGRHFYQYRKHRCGPASLVCACGHTVAA